MYTEVQKIKDWIKTRKLCTMDEHMAFYSEKAKWEYAILSKLEAFIDNMDASRVVDKGLEEAINNYIGYAPEIDEDSSTTAKRVAIRFGANWQKEQFEKNRLAACDRQTEEEAEIERDFVMGIIEKEHRQPTFDDAIKYGMKKMKEQMMKNTADAIIGLPYENKDGGYTHLIDVSRPLPVGSNKIAIIFKED